MLGAMFFVVPLSLVNAYAAYLVWGWSGVITPIQYLYGFMGGVRYNLIFALMTLALIVLGRARSSIPYKSSPTVVLLILAGVHASLCAALGYANNPFNMEYYSNFMKVLVFALLMPMFITSRFKIHGLLLVIALGLGFHGVLEGLKYLASAGGHRVNGIPASMISDNNHFATVMAMTVPFLYYLHIHSERSLIRYGFLGALFLVIVAIIGSYSRGAFLSLSIVGLWLVFTSRNKVMAGILVLLAGAGVMLIAAETWFDRISTIQTATEDASFMGRVVAWRASSAIALANPLFGGGFHSLQAQHVWETFRLSTGLMPFFEPLYVRQTAMAAHSIYFEVLGDQGFLGLAIFLSILFNALRTGRQIRKLLKAAPDEYLWAKDLAGLLSAVLIAYMVGGASVSLAYYELVYIVVMLMEMLKAWVLRNLPAADLPAQMREQPR